MLQEAASDTALMMAALQLVCAATILLFVLASDVFCFPDGAPRDACADLSPSPVRHRAGPQDQEALPYILGEFNTTFAGPNGTLGYVPGRTYDCKLKIY